jgi:hypothetical protein
MGNAVKRDGTWTDGRLPAGIGASVTNPSGPPPEGFERRHAWPQPLPWWGDAGTANVREAPYNAKGDGKTDDTGVIQKVIDEHDSVFLPKGEYAISRPLRLRGCAG